MVKSQQDSRWLHHVPANDAALPRPALRRGRDERSSLLEGRGEGLSPRAVRVETAPHPECCAIRPLPAKERGEVTLQAQFVFATLGGAAVVTNDVASSIAGPNGVGMVMRKGTRMRVPAIGTKAISIRRSVARYLITGRSGM